MGSSHYSDFVFVNNFAVLLCIVDHVRVSMIIYVNHLVMTLFSSKNDSSVVYYMVLEKPLS